MRYRRCDPPGSPPGYFDLLHRAAWHFHAQEYMPEWVASFLANRLPMPVLYWTGCKWLW